MNKYKLKNWLTKLNMIDRRIIFLFIAIAVIIPTIFPGGCKEYPTEMSANIYNKIETLPSGSRVLMSLDYDPASAPELQPMTNALLRHLCMKKHKIYLMTLWQTAPSIIRRAEGLIKTEFPEMKEEIDYVNLGFKGGLQGVINAILTDIYQMYSTDNKGDNLKDPKFEVMKGVNNLGDMDLIISVSTGTPGLKEWIQFGGDMVKKPTCGGSTAVATPLLFPYYPQQMFGILGGIKGAAEYEQLLIDGHKDRLDKILKTKPIQIDKEIAKLEKEISTIDNEIKNTGIGNIKRKSVFEANKKHLEDLKAEPVDEDMYKQAIMRMGPQTVAHLVIIIFIIIGNITFFIIRRMEKNK